MRLHGPSPPQGKTSTSLLFSLLPSHIQYSPPQGISAVAPSDAAGALVQTLTLDALVQTLTLDALVQTGTL